MQGEEWPIIGLLALQAVEIHVFPALQPHGLALGQPGAHRKIGLGQEEARRIVGFGRGLGRVVHRILGSNARNCGPFSNDGGFGQRLI